ncbi:O-antigen ligase [Paenibacillus sp. P22]|uniref:O-antigen ligase family protein n=1 Tax=Paenibacillus sp. P22 TaxID=483908 RepID=UPI0004314035|nr:O-antigen ligase family protein [Paenibacillus sp. P22]CDN41439.1 Putative uncharacterized protein [Paenibacillus sp. P22]
MTNSNILINLVVPFFFFFMMFFSPLVLNQYVYYAFGMLLFFFVITQSHRNLFTRSLLLSLLIFSSFLLYFGLRSTLSLDKDMLKRMATVAMFIGTFVLNYILVKSFLLKNTTLVRDRLLKFIAVMFNVIAFYCLIEYALKFNPLFNWMFNADYQRYYSINRGYELYRVSGPMQHPIVMGNFLVVGTFLNFALFSHLKKNIYVVFALLNAAALFVTFSRSSYIALAAGAIAFLAFSFGQKRNIRVPRISMPKVIAFIFIAVALILVMSLVQMDGKSLIASIAERFSGASGTASVAQRSGGIKYVLDMMLHSNLLNFLIGHGYGMLSWDMRENNTSIFLSEFFIIDNQYFTFFYEFGILGIIVLFAGIVSILRKTFMNRQIDHSPLLRFTLAAFVAIMVNIVFYEGAYWTSIAFLLSFVLALNTNLLRRN